jgi:hypothetical protein
MGEVHAFVTQISRSLSVHGSALPAHTQTDGHAVPVERLRQIWSLSALVEVDLPVEDDIALVVAHDVVAVQAVAVLVEVVGALGALVAAPRAWTASIDRHS